MYSFDAWGLAKCRIYTPRDKNTLCTFVTVVITKKYCQNENFNSK